MPQFSEIVKVLLAPYMEPDQVLQIQFKVDLGVMAIKGYYIFPQAPELKLSGIPLCQI